MKPTANVSEETKDQCPTHRLPFVVDDKIRGQKFCRMCLMGFVEGDDLKSKHRTTLLQSIESMLSQSESLSDTVTQEQPLLNDKFSDMSRHVDEIFEAIIAGVSAEREHCRKQLFQRKGMVQETLGKSLERIDEYRAGLAQLRDAIKKPLGGTPVDLVVVEHQATSIKKGIAVEEKKVSSIKTTIYDSEVINDYTEQKLKTFVGECVKMNLAGEKLAEKSLEMSKTELQTDTMGPADSVSENFEPVLLKFVWNTRQADCYQVLKNIFCTLTIPSVVSKDQDVRNASFVIPKFSKSVITEYNRVYLIGGARLDTMAPLKHIFEFELETLKLIKRANMRTGRYHHAAVYNSNFIYVSGGCGQSMTLNNCERYDVAHDCWSDLAKMTYPRSCHSLCLFGELTIYAIFGQVAADTVASSVERYEMVNDVWTPLSLTVPKMVRNMKHLGSFAISKDEILIFGGAETSGNQFCADAFVLYPALGEFKRVEKMKSATIFRNQPVCYKGRVYAFGVDNYIHIFDIPTRRWNYIYDKLS